MLKIYKKAIFSTCLPTLRPLFNVAVRGHHCSSHDFCPRCEASKNAKTLKSSKNGRLGSDEVQLPGSGSSSGKYSDSDGQWTMLKEQSSFHVSPV